MLMERAAEARRPDLLREIRRTQQEMNRFFRGLDLGLRPEFPPLNLWAGAEGAILTAEIPGVSPDQIDVTVHQDVDMRDTGKAVEVTAELPGMEDADVDVSVAEGALTIRGEKKSEREREGKGYVLRERSYGEIERVVPLPEGLDLDAAVASFKNGVLTVTIPKTAEAQAAVKRVRVQRR